MTRDRTMTLLATTVFLAALAVAPGCGGGSDSTPTSSGPVATFTPDTAAPAPGTIALLPGTVVGVNTNVRVTVTGVSGFFGAAFRITYDTTALVFNGMTTTDSFLRTGNDSDALFLEDHHSSPGEVLITATRVDPSAVGTVDVSATADLVILNFSARKVITVGTAEGRIDFGDPRQACDGTVVPPGCGAITVTWSGGGISAQ